MRVFGFRNQTNLFSFKQLTIQEEMLKSAELTGLWEKKLRQVERGEYQASDFLNELKEMVRQIVLNVKRSFA